LLRTGYLLLLSKANIAQWQSAPLARVGPRVGFSLAVPFFSEYPPLSKSYLECISGESRCGVKLGCLNIDHTKSF